VFVVVGKEACEGLEADDLLLGDLDGLSCTGIATAMGGNALQGELAEVLKDDIVTFLDGIGEGAENGVQNIAYL
jgi:hypothetical protein